MSVRINLNYIEDKKYTEEIQRETDSIYKEAGIINSCLRKKINDILEK